MPPSTLGCSATSTLFLGATAASQPCMQVGYTYIWVCCAWRPARNLGGYLLWLTHLRMRHFSPVLAFVKFQAVPKSPIMIYTQ